MLPITFKIEDFKAIDLVHDNLMVISVEIANCILKILPHDDPLFGFIGE